MLNGRVMHEIIQKRGIGENRIGEQFKFICTLSPVRCWPSWSGRPAPPRISSRRTSSRSRWPRCPGWRSTGASRPPRRTRWRQGRGYRLRRRVLPGQVACPVPCLSPEVPRAQIGLIGWYKSDSSPFPLPRSPATSKSTGGDRLCRTVLTDSARRVSGLVSALARRSVAGTEEAAGGHSMMAVSPRYKLNSVVIGSLQLID